jgi:hypothetical protein
MFEHIACALSMSHYCIPPFAQTRPKRNSREKRELIHWIQLTGFGTLRLNGGLELPDKSRAAPDLAKAQQAGPVRVRSLLHAPPLLLLGLLLGGDVKLQVQAGDSRQEEGRRLGRLRRLFRLVPRLRNEEDMILKTPFFAGGSVTEISLNQTSTIESLFCFEFDDFKPRL